MKKKIKVLVCCASGSGTSMMIKLNAEKLCKSLGIDAKVEHSPISEGRSRAGKYDVVLTTLNFVNMFDAAKATGTVVIGIKNPLSKKEIEQGFKDGGLLD